MNSNKQILIRWIKSLFSASSARQLGSRKTKNPPPLYMIGDAVKVIATAENSERRGEVREHIWHHKNAEWVYFISEKGRDISKRYTEDAFEVDFGPVPQGRTGEAISKKLTASGSLVEAHELLLEMVFVEGEPKQFANPLGTEFDLADIFIGRSKERLDCSPFLHVWSNEEVRKFSNVKGIWLSANSENLFLEFAVGMKYANPEDCAMFFPIIDELHGTTKPIRLVVTCSN